MTQAIRSDGAERRPNPIILGQDFRHASVGGAETKLFFYIVRRVWTLGQKPISLIFIIIPQKGLNSSIAAPERFIDDLNLISAFPGSFGRG